MLGIPLSRFIHVVWDSSDSCLELTGVSPARGEEYRKIVRAAWGGLALLHKSYPDGWYALVPRPHGVFRLVGEKVTAPWAAYSGEVGYQLEWHGVRIPGRPAGGAFCEFDVRKMKLTRRRRFNARPVTKAEAARLRRRGITAV